MTPAQLLRSRIEARFAYPGHRPSRLSYRLAALAFAGVLVAYGNLVSAIPEGIAEAYDWASIAGGFLLMGVAVSWAIRYEGLTPEAIGLRADRLTRDLLIGLFVGVTVVLPAVLYFLFPVGMPGGAIEYEDARETDWPTFLTWALLRQPLGTSVFEEVMFRGVLQALAVRAFGVWRGILFAAVAFALWHIVINYITVQDTNASESVFATAAAQAVSMAVLVFSGVLFSVLRVRTGSLVAPIAFHWAVVVLMHGTLFLETR